MTYITRKLHSGLNIAVLEGLPSEEVSSVRYLKFDKNDIPANFGVTSTNDYQFTLSSGSSYILIGTTTIRRGTTNIRWYDETNNQYIGWKANIFAGDQNITSNYQRTLNPQYRREAAAVILSTAFGGSDIVVSLRVVSDSSNPVYDFTSWTHNVQPLPILQIIKA